MAIDSYAALKAGPWTHRTDLLGQFDNFLDLIEAAMNRRLRTRQMVARISFPLVVGNAYFDLPDDFLGPRSMVVASTPARDLELTNQDILDQLAWPTAQNAAPDYYAVVGNEFRLYPVPDQAYTATLTYYQQIPGLTSVNTSNWVLTSDPDAYIYGLKWQAALFSQDDDRAQSNGDLFKLALDDMQQRYSEKTGKRLGVDASLLWRRRRFNILTGAY